MKNITGYCNNNYSCSQTSRSVGASGASGSSGSSGTVGSSGAQGTSGSTGTPIEKLHISEVIALFKRGDITDADMDKWLAAHENQISDLSKVENSKKITYTFTYKGVKYNVSCDKKAPTRELGRKNIEIPDESNGSNGSNGPNGTGGLEAIINRLMTQDDTPIPDNTPAELDKKPETQRQRTLRLG